MDNELLRAALEKERNERRLKEYNRRYDMWLRRVLRTWTPSWPPQNVMKFPLMIAGHWRKP